MANGVRTAVLVVDDHEEFRDLTSTVLTRDGYFVVTAADPQEALDAVARFRPDVCLLDIGLPGMDGYELAARLRGHVPGLWIIATSGGLREAGREIESGAVIDDFLGKPFTFEALESTLAGFRGHGPRASAPPV